MNRNSRLSLGWNINEKIESCYYVNLSDTISISRVSRNIRFPLRGSLKKFACEVQSENGKCYCIPLDKPSTKRNVVIRNSSRLLKCSQYWNHWNNLIAVYISMFISNWESPLICEIPFSSFSKRLGSQFCVKTNVHFLAA